MPALVNKLKKQKKSTNPLASPFLSPPASLFLVHELDPLGRATWTPSWFVRGVNLLDPLEEPPRHRRGWEGGANPPDPLGGAIVLSGIRLPTPPPTGSSLLYAATCWIQPHCATDLDWEGGAQEGGRRVGLGGREPTATVG